MTLVRNTVLLFVFALFAVPMSAKTWFVRADGGNRYDTSYTAGECDGLADAAYPGKGVNRHCAFADVRYMYMLGTYGNIGWVMQGGDTLVIRSCRALRAQQNPDAPHCRIGLDTAQGGYNAQNFWCGGTPICSIPPPPSGTAAQHTRILGECAYGTYRCNAVDTYPYTKNNLTQLFGGFGSSVVLYLNGSKNVDLEGLEITTHNGKCARYGTTHPLPGCARQAPYSDQADQGIVTDNKTSDILLQDVSIHGFSSNGISGPIGGPFKLNRVAINFNAFAGWNFDDGHSTPNGRGASIAQNSVTMVGNGCQEEYPITHPQFPAKGCWDSSTGGFGDAWSGQGADLDYFTCDHCNISYNTKDGAMGPHTGIRKILLTNSTWVGNMGQAGKWGQGADATFLFENNIVVGNCMRMSRQLPGAAQNFDGAVNQPGSGLGGYCRAAGAVFDYFSGPHSTIHFNHNTIVTYQPTIFEPSCSAPNKCGTSPIYFTNNLVLGYNSGFDVSGLSMGKQPGLFYKDDSSVPIVAANNLWFDVKGDDGTCNKNGNLCVDPALVNEPPHQQFGRQTLLDLSNFHPSRNSPAVGHGKAISGLLTDYYGNQRASPPTIGAVEAAR